MTYIENQQYEKCATPATTLVLCIHQVQPADRLTIVGPSLPKQGYAVEQWVCNGICCWLCIPRMLRYGKVLPGAWPRRTVYVLELEGNVAVPF
jgi:hypothetical protein